MAAFVIRCVVISICVIATTAAGSSIEIFDGTFYGIDEDQNGTVLVQLSHRGQGNHSEPTVVDGVAVLESQTNLPVIDVDQLSPRKGGNYNRRHHSRHRHGHHHRHHGDDQHDRASRYGMHHHWSANWTDEQKLIHVCSKLQSYSSSDAASTSSRRHGMMSSKLQMLSEQNRQTVIEMWRRRKQEMIECCNKDSVDEKMQCSEKMREARYNRVCRGEEPLCPWAEFMSNAGRQRPRHRDSPRHESRSNTTAVCCQLQGVERVQCFTQARNEFKLRAYGHGGSHAHGSSHQPRFASRRMPRPHSEDSERRSPPPHRFAGRRH